LAGKKRRKSPDVVGVGDAAGGPIPGSSNLVVLRSRVVPVFLRRAQRLGIELTDLPKRFGVARDAANLAEVGIGLDAFRALCDEIARKANDPLFGYRAGREAARGEYGLIEYLVRNGSNVRAAAEAMARYGGVVKAQQRSFDPATGLLKEAIPGEPECLGRQGNEFAMTYFVRIGREVAGAEFVPRRVFFAHAPPPHRVTEMTDYFGTTEFVYRAGFNAIELSPEVQALPIHSADAALRDVLESRAKEIVTADEASIDDLGQIRRLVAEELPSMDVSAENLARKMGVSERTLHRRLAAAGTSVRDVVEQVREGLARTYLADPQRGIAEIATLLGYSDQRAFARAFRRWTGETPGDHRRRATT
jgi:AraC-like DNA-binding protein